MQGDDRAIHEEPARKDVRHNRGIPLHKLHASRPAHEAVLKARVVHDTGPSFEAALDVEKSSAQFQRNMTGA